MKKKTIKTNAIRFLEKNKIPFQMSEYAFDEKTLDAIHTAETLGIEAQRLFKTLVLSGNETGPIVVVIPGDTTLDLKKTAKVSGNKKVDMLPLKELEPLTGYVHGGCSPLGMKKHFPTYLSDKALEYETIHVSAGKRGLQVSLNPTTLADLTKAIFVDVTHK